MSLGMFLATIAAVDDEGERCRLVATGLPAVVPCSLSGVGLRPDCEGEWRFVIQHDEHLLSKTELDAAMAGLEHLAEHALDHRSMLIVQSGDDHAPAGALEQLGVRTLVVIALRTVGNRFGALFIGRDSDARLAEAEDTVLRTVAQQLTILSENARLRRALQGHVDELENLVAERTLQLQLSEKRQRALLELNNSIVTELDRAALFDAVAHVLEAVVPFDRASLAEYDSATDTFRVEALARTPSTAAIVEQGSSFPRQGSHLQQVLDEKRPRVRSDLEAGGTTAQEEGLRREGLRSYVAVPLVAKGVAIGTLNVASTDPDRYSDDDAAFLAEVASQIALAIDNMQAYEEISGLKARLQQENLYLREEAETDRQFADIVGTSQPIRAVLAAIKQVAATDATVLLTGETGTGKELVARAIHAASKRQAQTMVTVNCAALPAGLLESELFGHEKGAFTGALARRIGRFELADKSTHRAPDPAGMTRSRSAPVPPLSEGALRSPLPPREGVRGRVKRGEYEDVPTSQMAPALASAPVPAPVPDPTSTGVTRTCSTPVPPPSEGDCH